MLRDDQFLGISVPMLRQQARQHRAIPLTDVEALLGDPFHEIRFFALLVLVEQFKKADHNIKQDIISLYLSNTRFINNWDLVDVSCYDLLGRHCFEEGTDVLFELARSSNMWERRIAMVSSYHMIKQNNFQVTLDLASTLLPEPEEIVQKAIGWMLKEVGKRDETALVDFVVHHGKRMTPLAIRTALEKLDKQRRAAIRLQIDA